MSATAPDQRALLQAGTASARASWRAQHDYARAFSLATFAEVQLAERARTGTSGANSDAVGISRLWPAAKAAEEAEAQA